MRTLITGIMPKRDYSKVPPVEGIDGVVWTVDKHAEAATVAEQLNRRAPHLVHTAQILDGGRLRITVTNPRQALPK